VLHDLERLTVIVDAYNGEQSCRIFAAELSAGCSVRDAQIVQFGAVAARSAPALAPLVRPDFTP